MVQLQKYLKNLILFYLKNIMYICCVDTTFYSTVNLKQQHGKAFKIIGTKIKNQKSDFKRYLYASIDWNSRLIIMTGARGAGKLLCCCKKWEVIPTNRFILA
jgi:hypothetical protein